MELTIFNENDERIKYIKQALKRRIVGFIEEGLEWVIISGQMGVEMWTAEVVLDLKETYDIKIGMIPPFENQHKRWPEPLQHKYEELLFTVDFSKPIFNSEYKGPHQFRARDKWLMEKSDACLILVDEDHPGDVGYFYDAAKQQDNYPIYLITPLDLDDVVEEMRMNEGYDEHGY